MEIIRLRRRAIARSELQQKNIAHSVYYQRKAVVYVSSSNIQQRIINKFELGTSELINAIKSNPEFKNSNIKTICTYI